MPAASKEALEPVSQCWGVQWGREKWRGDGIGQGQEGHISLAAAP